MERTVKVERRHRYCHQCVLIVYSKNFYASLCSEDRSQKNFYARFSEDRQRRYPVYTKRMTRLAI